MKAQSFHNEFNPIVQDIIDVLDERTDLKGEIELQMKYAFLKKCTSQAEYKALVATSQKKPVIITRRRDSKNYRVNAKCEEWQFDNAYYRLKQINQRTNKKSKESYQFCLSIGEVRYIYDCNSQKWQNVKKNKLFERQQNVLSKDTLFRIDMSEKQEDENVDFEKIKTVLNKERDQYNVIRYKRIFQYNVHKFYTIYCESIFETEDEKEYEKMRSIIFDKKNITEEIKAVMKAQEKRKTNIKCEMELRFTHEGIQFMKKCEEIDIQTLFSKAFDFFRDLSLEEELSQRQLEDLMGGLSLKEQKKELKEGQQKQEKTLKREDCRDFMTSIKGNKKMQYL